MDPLLMHRSEIMERQVGNEHMLYDSVGRVVHVVNETAYFIWQRCDGKHTIQDIIREAMVETNLPKEALQKDIEECVAVFREKGLMKD